MDNFVPFPSSNVNSFQELSMMDLENNHSLFTPQDSLFTMNDPLFTTMPTYDQPPQLFPPYAYPMEQSVVMNPQPFHSPEAYPQIPVMQTGSGSGFGSLVGNPGLMQERGVFLDPHMSTKLARINRKKAMIRSRNNASPSSSSSPTESVETRRQVTLMKNNLQTVDKEELFLYLSFDNKKLRVLLVKSLKNSDVGTLGRIVLPKREAEVNLPELSDKEGIIVEMRDVDSMYSWSFKYKFWSNNKSRMYVLENTGEFVRNYGVETGDSLTIYEDESKNLYFSIGRKSSDKQKEVIVEDDSMELNLNNFEDITFDYIPPNNEDDASIAMILGNLNDNYPIPNNPIPENHYPIPDNHYPIPDNLMGLPLPVELQDHQAASSLPSLDHVASSNDYVNVGELLW